MANEIVTIKLKTDYSKEVLNAMKDQVNRALEL